MERTGFLLMLALSLWVSTAQGQQLDEYDRSAYNRASYYNYSEPGDVTMLVNVWGTVRNPGLYEVPEGTTLNNLVSLAGGPSIRERSREDERTVLVRLSRRTGGTRETVYETAMRDDIFATEEDPVLQEGDVLTVDTAVRQGFTWRDIVTIVGATASVAIAIERIAGR